VDNLAGVIVFDLNAKHPVQLSEISDLEMLTEAGLEFLNKSDGGGNNQAVIHMDYHNSELAFDNDGSEVNGLIHSALLESKLDKDTCKFLVPLAARLLKPIKGLDEAQNMYACIRNLVAWGMVHVEDLIVVEFPVEISTFDINLVHLHAQAICYCYNGTCG
jgi:hypothetical protein